MGVPASRARSFSYTCVRGVSVTGAGMADNNYILAIDQGTTSSRAILFDRTGNIEAVSQYEFTQYFPNDGWVEHDPEEIWDTVFRAVQDVLETAGADGKTIACIGITNQRETTIVWDRKTGKPIYNAIVWQDRRTAPTCRALTADGCLEAVQKRTGLLLDPYFSATKIAWILDNVEGARDKALAGELAFGTVDSFLIWRLTGGKVHATDATNASRTSIFNIELQEWDDDLLRTFRVPRQVLPEVRDSSDDFGMTDPDLFDGLQIPITGVAGDQQAAAIGQCCFSVGDIKSTYGTGCFVILNTGDELVRSSSQLLTTVAYRLNGKTTYALEGSIFVAGAAVQWLRDGIEVVESAAETEEMALSVDDSHGVYLVPAFTGLGAPYWDPDARGAILGLTRGTTRAELARATLESVVYQTYDLFTAMADDGVKPLSLKVDGGMVANAWMAQYLSDILKLTVERPKVMETTALGAAYLAGLAVGLYGSLDEIRDHWRLERAFQPRPMDSDSVIARWHKAVAAVRAFA